MYNKKKKNRVLACFQTRPECPTDGNVLLIEHLA